jgi:hypothetical protein
MTPLLDEHREYLDHLSGDIQTIEKKTHLRHVLAMYMRRRFFVTLDEALEIVNEYTELHEKEKRKQAKRKSIFSLPKPTDE